MVAPGPKNSKEKRAFSRRMLRLEGVCSLPDAGSRKVEIRDFCPGGMLLSYDEPAAANQPQPSVPSHGDVIEIRCTVPSAQGRAALQFRGRVVRIEGGAAGLAFIDPDMDALHILYDFAKKSQTETPANHVPEPSQVQRGGGQPAQAILQGCKQIAKACIGPMMSDFQEHVLERWFTLAGIVQTVAEKNAYYDAVNIFNSAQGEAFKRAFEAQMMKRLDAYSGQAAEKPQESFTLIPAKNLSLVEQDAFEEWLALSDVARKVEEGCQAPLSDLGFRLGELLKTSLDKENNPFWPDAFCKAFQETLKGFRFDPIAQKAAYTVFKDSLVAAAAALYVDLNQYLVKQGVIPDLRHKYKIKIARSSPPRKDNAEHAVAGTENPAAASGGMAGGNASVNGVHAPQTDAAPAPQDWYRIVQELDDLRKQASHQTMKRPESPQIAPGWSLASATTASSEAAGQFYTPEELLFALSRINFSGLAQSAAGNVDGDVKTQLLSILSDGTTQTANKQLPGREAKILDVAGNLFGSVLNDQLVSGNVRPWLEQLSVPMMKLAIRDDSLFTDKSHLARQVINNLAQLEFYGEAGDKGQNAVRKRITGLLDTIVQAEVVTPELLNRVLKELGSLIRVQNKAYEENLKDLVAACEQGQTPLASEDSPAATDISVLQADEAGGEALQEWLKRVRRLSVGNSLLLPVDSTPQRLKLAWVGKNLDRYVFVNVKGLKALTLAPDMLARQLHSGEAVVLDDGGEPLLDRAQYSMLQKMHRDLVHETTHDHLTGLLNRREFEKHLAEALASARQDERQHIICLIDLDQFAVVNNTFGYDGGDRLILEITQLLKGVVKERGILARLGSAEFGMLFEVCPVEEALSMTERFKNLMQDYRFACDNKSLSVSFSAGLVPVVPDSNSVISIFQEAEASCQIARSKGVNYVQVYSPEDTGVSRHLQVFKWVTRIDEALDNDTLELRYQPIVNIADEGLAIHHSEVLLGVMDEDGKLISPAEFVLAAEHFRRMAAVDRWVIERVFRWMVENEARLAQVGGLAINLSGSSLNEEGFADYIIEQAQKFQVPMDKICFEITETAGIANLSNASEFILAVKQTGCMFSLDDFGSGMSSYAYLKNLPVDFLKIDGAFIKKMDENPYDYAVVKSITEIGHFMGKKIIAEYVENENILNKLREIGVDYAQGYAIAKPQSLIIASAVAAGPSS